MEEQPVGAVSRSDPASWYWYTGYSGIPAPLPGAASRVDVESSNISLEHPRDGAASTVVVLAAGYLYSLGTRSNAFSVSKNTKFRTILFNNSV